jgi:hypothetical protein
MPTHSGPRHWMEVLHVPMELRPANEFLDGRLHVSRTGLDGLAMRKIVAPLGNRAPVVRPIASHFADWTIIVHVEE